MSNKDANKENEGGGALSSAAAAAAAAIGYPTLHKNVIVYATDMTEEMRSSIIGIAQRAFNAPVNNNGKKVYQAIADSIRSEFEKEYDIIVGGNGNSGVGNDSSRGVGPAGKSLSSGSGGWSCVVGGAFWFSSRLFCFSGLPESHTLALLPFICHRRVWLKCYP